MAKGLDEADKIALAAYLTGRMPKLEKEAAYDCKSPAPPLVIGKDDWPVTGQNERNTRSQMASGIQASDVPRLKLKWAFAYPAGAPGPAVVAGQRVFLSTGDGRVISLDANTGCRYWAYPAGGIIRQVSVGESGKGGNTGPSVVFGDDRTVIKALDAQTGKLRWETRVEDHPLARITAAPIIWGNRVFVPISSIEDPISHDPRHECCTSQGGVAALDLETGRLIWKQRSLRRPPAIVDAKAAKGARRFSPAGGAIYLPLTVDAARGRIYAATAESYDLTNPAGSYSIIAFDANNGRRVWEKQFLPDAQGRKKLCEDVQDDECRNRFSMSAPVVLHKLANGRDVLLASSKSGTFYGLDPDASGRIVWQSKLAKGGSMGGLMYGPAIDAGIAYVSISDLYASSPDAEGGLVAVDPSNGKILWRQPGIGAKCSWQGEGCTRAQTWLAEGRERMA